MKNIQDILNISHIKNVIYYSLGGVAGQVVALITLPVFTRYLSPADYGIFGYTGTFSFFLLNLGNLSFNSYVLRNYQKYKASKKSDVMISSILSFLFVYNAVLLVSEIIIFPLVLEHFHVQVPFYPYFLIMLISTFLKIFIIYPLAVFRMKSKAFCYMVFSLMILLLNVSVSLILVIYFQLGVQGRFYGMLVSNGIFFIISFYLLRDELTLKLDSGHIAKAFKFSMPLVPSSISFTLMGMLDRIILERYISVSELGIYTIGYTMGFAIYNIYSSILKTLEPKVFEMADKPDFLSNYRIIKNMYMVLIVFIGVTVALFSKNIVILLTSENFWAAAEIMPIIVLSAVFNGIYSIYCLFIMAVNKTKMLVLPIVTGAIVNLVLNLFLIPRFGMFGAAGASAFSYLIIVMGSSIQISLIKHKIRLNFMKESILIFLFFSTAVGIIIWGNTHFDDLLFFLVKCVLVIAGGFFIYKRYVRGNGVQN